MLVPEFLFAIVSVDNKMLPALIIMLVECKTSFWIFIQKKNIAAVETWETIACVFWFVCCYLRWLLIKPKFICNVRRKLARNFASALSAFTYNSQRRLYSCRYTFQTETFLTAAFDNVHQWGLQSPKDALTIRVACERVRWNLVESVSWLLRF